MPTKDNKESKITANDALLNFGRGLYFSALREKWLEKFPDMSERDLDAAIAFLESPLKACEAGSFIKKEELPALSTEEKPFYYFSLEFAEIIRNFQHKKIQNAAKNAFKNLGEKKAKRDE